MKVLIVGGAGYVGGIIRPALQAEHEVYCFDRNAVPELGLRSIVADVNDAAAITYAVYGMDAIIYLAMGTPPSEKITPVNHHVDVIDHHVNDIDLAFNVNVRGLYRFLQAASRVGVRRFINAGSLSVYRYIGHDLPLDESVPPDAWEPYGISKRLGEQLCAAAAQQYPQSIIITLRLMLPRREEDFPGPERLRQRRKTLYLMGPHDTRCLFEAALACQQQGAHVLQATGDVDGLDYSHDRAGTLLGWRPQGR